MKSRSANAQSDAVGLFPFLAVLLCTMGALLVLLVILAQRAGESLAERADASAASPALDKPATEPQESSEAEDTPLLTNLAEQLEQVDSLQRQLNQKREQIRNQLARQRQLLSNSEEQTRRLEHELARLMIAHEQLKQAEQEANVDQAQANRETKRLKELIEEREKELETLREENSGRKAYAIVPYKGPNGTHHPPICIECVKDALILQPEGIRIEAQDLIDPTWARNPLAAVIRATSEHINQRDAAAGDTARVEAYPYFLIRPEGQYLFYLAQKGVQQWGGNYGYDYVSEDASLDYPSLPDPQLAKTQQHAISVARDQLAHRVLSAPGRFKQAAGSFKRRGLNVSFGGMLDETGAGGGYGTAQGQSYSPAGYGPQGTPPESLGSPPGSGNGTGGFAANAGGGRGEAAAHDQAPGSPAEAGYGRLEGGNRGPGGESGVGDRYASTGSDSAGAGGSGDSEHGTTGGSPGGTSPTGQAAGGSQSSASQGSQGASATATSSGASGSPSSMASAGANAGQAMTGSAQAENSSPAAEMSSNSAEGQFTSIAEQRGSNWAVEQATRNSLPIRRTIQVIVRRDRIALLPSRHGMDGAEATGRLIMLDQSPEAISEEFVAALRERVEGWGLAGNGLFWRPVLKLHIGPDARHTTEQVMRLLDDSGVEVTVPQTAQDPRGDRTHAR